MNESMKTLEIKSYEHRYHKQFKSISLDWLHRYNLYEKADDDLLEHPQKYIQLGSFIFLAHYNAEIVGTVSLVPKGRHTFEIVKLGVIDAYRGLGFGKKLMQICLEVCKKENTELITLETSSKLKNALKLYEKLGFIHVEIRNSKYASADVKMELKLK
jgi:ribosomal protein S18 acetylase RimI-like enzyme